MKLIGSDTSPFVRKVRIVMAEKKIEYRYQPEDVWSPDSGIRQLNPLAKVPCLVIDDGSAIFDSRVIVEYLDALTPVHRLIPPGGRERIDVRCWEALADGLLDAAVLIRLEHTRREPAQRSPAWIARQQTKIDDALAAVSQSLGEQPWCCDGRYSLADIATGCALAYLDLRFPENAWRERHPNLGRLLERLNTRPAFADTVPIALG
jgi:glutathione S-transferase